MRSFTTVGTVALLAIAAPVAHAEGLDDHIDRWGSSLALDAVAIAAAQDFGHILGIQAEYAPMPWLYVTAIAGENQGGMIGGGGVHVRAIVSNPVAFSVGANLLHSADRVDTTTDHELFGPTISNAYTYDPATWLAVELAIEARSQDGISVKLVGGIGIPLAGGGWKATTMDGNNGLFGSNNPTTTNSTGTPGVSIFLGLELGFGFNPR